MLAWLIAAVLSCPMCDGRQVGSFGAPVEAPRARLLERRDGTYDCARCGAYIEPERGRWFLAGGFVARPLPGVLGRLFWREGREAA